MLGTGQSRLSTCKFCRGRRIDAWFVLCHSSNERLNMTFTPVGLQFPGCANTSQRRLRVAESVRSDSLVPKRVRIARDIFTSHASQRLYFDIAAGFQELARFTLKAVVCQTAK